jgi:Domain of unknown function (DUF4338)
MSTKITVVKALPRSVVLRGRAFSRTELIVIRKMVRQFFVAGRTKISEEICKQLEWKQPNGWLKDRACRDVLRKLHELNLVRLPKPKLAGRARLYSKWTPPISPKLETKGPITELKGPLTLRMAKGNNDEKHWNQLVQQYHYLGHKVAVGRCIKFLIYGQGDLLGAISLTECAWNVEERDKYVRLLGYAKHEIANNGRFLILPHVRINNLASRSLALLATAGVKQWNDYYGQPLKCLETFVDKSRFHGTSYKAANWIPIGLTKGYRKCGSAFHNSQTPKYIFLYPLCSFDRSRLPDYF